MANRLDLEAAEETVVANFSVTPLVSEVTPGRELEVEVAFSVKGKLRRSFSRASWQEAYEAHDLQLRLAYELTLVRRAAIFHHKVFGPLRLVKKAKLYWSRNPDLEDHIWAMVVDEDGMPHIFDREEQVDAALFDFRRRVLIPSGALAPGDHVLKAELRLRWGRHLYVEGGELRAESPPFGVKVKQA
jgi:hypothetical protein